MDLGGRPDLTNVHLEDAQTVRKVRSFDRIIPYTHHSGAESGCRRSGVRRHSRAFKMDGFEGQVLIVHNANVGSMLCPDCKAAGQKSCEHVFIDDFGDLKYFTPQTMGNTATLKLGTELKNAAIYDVSTGKRLKQNTSGFFLDIGPGDAAILLRWQCNRRSENQSVVRAGAKVKS